MKKNEYFPLLSIIVPVYNTKEFLNICVDSILSNINNQVEIILVDDGSSDGSELICDKYKNKISNIKVIHQKNKGVSSARNSGLFHADGKYVTFVDSDDSVNSNYISSIINLINKSNYDFIVFNYSCVYNNSYVDNIIEPFNLSKKKQYLIEYLKNNLLFNSPCNKIYSMDIIKKNSILFDEEISIGEDMLFNLKYIEFCEKTKILNGVLYNYYQRESSLTHNYNFEKLIKNQYTIYNYMYEFYCEKDYDLSYILKDYIISLIGTIKKINYSNKYTDRQLKNFIKEYYINSNIKKIKNYSQIKKYQRILVFLLNMNMYYLSLYIIKLRIYFGSNI